MTTKAANPRPIVRPYARLLPAVDPMADQDGPAAAPAALLAAAWRRRGRAPMPLRRRGVDFGHVLPLRTDPPDAATALLSWRAAEPVFLPGLLGSGPRRAAAAIAASLDMFERLRQGGDFLTELERRLGDDRELQYRGSAADADDPRAIERVFVDAVQDGRVVASDLWARLAWISPGDRSLRIRFSSGQEQLDDWLLQTDATARWVDEFAARAFPECRAIVGCRPLWRTLRRLIARPFRLSERIVYNNAPDGGAVFHHDAETGQLGVCYSQLEGQTAWLSLSKRRLARLLVQSGTATDLRRAMASLDRGDGDALRQRLDRDVAFARRLSAHGALFVLSAGDTILLPSHGIDDVAWHSVFALGDRPSLAHSYGIFPSVATAAARG